MRLCVKKIYCPHCRRSVQAEEESSNGQDRITCSKCGQVIYIGNGIYWRRGSVGEPAPGGQSENPPEGKAKKTKQSKA